MKLFYSTLFIISFGFSTVFSQWTSNPALGKAVRTGPRLEYDNFSVHDGRGGAFIFWQSSSGGFNDIVFTRLTSEGFHAFGSATSGRFLTSSNTPQYLVEAIPDGNNGVFVVYREGGLYLQHLDAAGLRLMGSFGKLISENEDTKCHLALDGNGGVFATWEEWGDEDAEFTYSLVQRFSSTGTAQWAPTNSGIRVVTNNAIPDTYNDALGIVESGVGEVIIAFVDNRNSNYDKIIELFDNLDIYAQKIDINGNRLWGAGGKQVCTNNKNQYSTSYGEKGKKLLTTDKAGGAIIAWEDYRNDPYNGDDGDGGDIFAQRLNSDGNPMWGLEGVAVCTAQDYQDDITMMPSGNGGAIITWNDERSSNSRIYTQIIRPDGTPLLPLNGKAVFADYEGYVAHPSTDNLYFLLAIENDEREVIVQKIEAATGNFLWGTGRLMANLSKNGGSPISIVHDGGSGAIVSYDFNDDIFANRVDGNGLLPVSLVQFNALYANGNTELSWVTAQEQNSSYFGVERSKDGLQFVEIGRLTAAGNSLSEKNYRFADPVNKAGFFEGSTVFYRLNMVDKDGKKAYSPVRKITIPISEIVVKIAGNPVQDQLKVLLTSPKQQQGQLKVFNLEGRLIHNQNLRLLEGQNQVNIAANSWPTGGYIIHFTNHNQTKSIQFIKN